MNTEFQLHPEAAQDITEIWEYIAERSPKGARRVREAILETIRGLVIFPNRGHRRSDLAFEPIRFWVVGNYLIAYVPDVKPLLVLAVVHARRNPRVIAAMLRGRSGHPDLE